MQLVILEVIVKKSNEIELDSPPIFEIGQKVRVKKLIKNDGTFIWCFLSRF
ncbi:MAG: nitrogen fixation protein NifZ [Sphaerospermopsis sp. SIO1G2]|nr:nitrogen fixation protein NifZ [Sphaerospermopsis sp. SIO1G2]